jgi:hypothetical protein
MNETRGTVVQVNVTPLSVQGDKAVCALTPRRALPDQEHVVGGIIVLKPRGAPYTVEFFIEPGIDQGQPDLCFDTSNPLSCNHGSCPGINDHNPQMHPQADESKKKLTIKPPPAPGAAQIHYSLNFEGSRFDPIIVKT